MRALLFVPLLAGTLFACGDAEPTDPTVGTTTATTTATTTCIPAAAPGNAPSPIDWTSDDSNFSPETAWDVGVVTDTNGPQYVQSIIPTDLKDAYFVFEAGADMDLNLRVQNSQNDFKFMHLHDATDGCFGEEISALAEDVGTWYIDNTYPVEAGRIYVMEIRIPGGGFF